MNDNVLNAASALTSWKEGSNNGKHSLEGGNDSFILAKKARVENHAMFQAVGAPVPLTFPPLGVDTLAAVATMEGASDTPQKKPYPFFYYADYSQEEDPDPLTPLTFPGRVPNFPAKLHAILSRPDLADIIDWLPHGRSWRILKPRDFETKVIPKFFEHAKFSSFVRQANGWGFRRITQGPDRGSYYHAKFLRGLPHLCKTMKRPGVAEKKIIDPDEEPDFTEISRLHPVPENADHESLLLQHTLKEGPKARMPIITGKFSSQQGEAQARPQQGYSYSGNAEEERPSESAPPLAAHESQYSQFSQQSFAPAPSQPSSASSTHNSEKASAAVNASYNGSSTNTYSGATSQQQQQHQQPAESSGRVVTPDYSPKTTDALSEQSLMAASMQFPGMGDSNNPAAAQFAAGFAAAMQMSQQHFFTMLNGMSSTSGNQQQMQIPPQFAAMMAQAQSSAGNH